MLPRAPKVKKLGVLIEINVGGEAAKSGVAPDSRKLEDLLLAARRLLEALEFRGLMTVPPFTNPEEAPKLLPQAARTA